MKKTWNLTNKLSSRNVGKTKRITQLYFEDREVNAPIEIAETLNCYFSGIGEKIASEIHEKFPDEWKATGICPKLVKMELIFA
jgi:hypothetical protein